jgi:hypothetical protein
MPSITTDDITVGVLVDKISGCSTEVELGAEIIVSTAVGSNTSLGIGLVAPRITRVKRNRKMAAIPAIRYTHPEIRSFSIIATLKLQMAAGRKQSPE